MGLGPPVCTKCKVILSLDNPKKKWYCPNCDEIEIDICLWELTKEEQEQYWNNTQEQKKNET